MSKIVFVKRIQKAGRFMKTFEQLNAEQKIDAIKYCEYEIVEAVSHGILDITLTNPNNQEVLEHMLSKSRKLESPRLAKIYLLGDKSIRAEIYKLAIVAASGGFYDKNGQPTLRGFRK